MKIFNPNHMRPIALLLFLFSHLSLFSQVPVLQDDFEGSAGIDTWYEDDCNMNTSFNNPFQTGINTSAKVLRYSDTGGLYANIGFNAGFSLNLLTSSVFSVKVYVPSNGITGSQNNQISLKLQDGLLPQPWTTQCEIIKPILLDQWQTITFDFDTDVYVNLDPSSPDPMDRWDFNRVLLQMNGENNTSAVVAYIDDFFYSGTNTEFDYLIWSDEFNVNGAVSSQKWFHQTQLPNGTSWYNGELQHYTNRTVNSSCSNGLLSILAKRENFNDQGQTKQFTSARLNSKFAFQYGRVEARAKLPIGAGTWPAIWMLGKNVIEPGGYWTPTHGTASWPACGEIDIMEHWGSNQNEISSAVHHPINGDLTIGEYTSNAQTLSTVSTDFHVYAVEWTDQSITFSVDGINHLSYNPPVKNQYTWPFNAEQYLLLNVAIEPSVLPGFVQSAMEVDYVRVYQQNTVNTTQITQAPKVKLFPNPVKDQLTLTNLDNLNGTLEIYSILGHRLYASVLKEGDTMIDVSAFQSGVYVAVLTSKSGVDTYKFVKQ